MKPLFQTEFDEKLISLNNIVDDDEYYFFELYAEDEKIIFGTQSRWAGFSDDDQNRELRKARRVYGRFARKYEEMLGVPYAVCNNLEEFYFYYKCGGIAFVNAELCEQYLADFLNIEDTFQFGNPGFVGSTMVHNQAKHRAPTPKLRMFILKRDNSRCKICGRSPHQNTDIVLHVHHIRPWSKGGATDPKNLITLCHTCHSGLVPHFDPSLYEYLENEKFEISDYLITFRKRVLEYRQIWEKEHKLF